MKKKTGVGCFALFILILLLLWDMTLPKPTLELPPELMPQVGHDQQKPVQPLQALLQQCADVSPGDLWVWNPESEPVLHAGEAVEAWVGEAKNLPDLCQAVQSDRRRFPLSGHHRNGYYAFNGSYPEYIHAVHVLLSLADEALRNHQQVGLEYLKAAAQLAVLLCDTPGQRESVAANQIFVLLGRYVLQDMPKQWQSNDLLCLFPDEAMCRTLGDSISWDILQSAVQLLENRKQAYSVYMPSNNTFKLDYWLIGTPWELQPNMKPLIDAHAYSKTATSGPFGVRIDWSRFYFGFWDYFKLDYLEHAVALDCVSRIRIQLMALARVKTIRDRIELDLALAERGEGDEPDPIQALVNELNLTNLFTGEVYQVDKDGNLILFPDGAAEPGGLGANHVNVPGVVDFGEFAKK